MRIVTTGMITLPETNIAPENGPLEKEIPIGNHNFQGLCLFQGWYMFSFGNPKSKPSLLWVGSRSKCVNIC